MKLSQKFYRNLFAINIILFLATIVLLLTNHNDPSDMPPISAFIWCGLIISTLITWLILLILSIMSLFSRLKIGLIGLALLLAELIALVIPTT